MARTTIRATSMYTQTMKYYIVKMSLNTEYHDTMIIAESDNLIDARAIIEELWAEGRDMPGFDYGIMPSITHSTMQQKEDTENVV